MKNKIIILIVILVVIILGAYLYSNSGSEENLSEEETLNVESDLTPIELTDEEKALLESEGIELPVNYGSVEGLQTVSSSNEIDDIEEDLLDTDLSALDAELEDIEDDLSGM